MSRISPLLSSSEAVQFLRLDEDYEQMADAIAALQRLARRKGIRAVKGIGKSDKWHVDELRRFVTELGGPSVCENGSDPPP